MVSGCDLPNECRAPAPPTRLVCFNKHMTEQSVNILVHRIIPNKTSNHHLISLSSFISMVIDLCTR